jgi:hypothetical protein
MTSLRGWMVATAALFVIAPFAMQAQQRAGAVAAQRVPGDRIPDSAGRERLEGEVRRAFARAVRTRVGLSDDQIGRLVPITQRHEQARRQLQREERDARMSLRAALRNEQTADAGRVDQLLQRMLDVQKRRVQLLETEQRDLATVMTPVQRAKFMALQEQLRGRMEQMRRRRMALFEDDMTPQQPPRRVQPPR